LDIKVLIGELREMPVVSGTIRPGDAVLLMRFLDQFGKFAQTFE
jgi:hypothetical protein